MRSRADLARQVRADVRDCRRLLRTGSRTFLAASHLLPARVRDAACALYAFCRIADDAVDEGSDRVAAVARMRARLAALYAGNPENCAADRALARVVAVYKIPRALPEALLDGFEWDALGRQYETLADLHAYAARVAGSVGVMMAMIMDVRDPRLLARASELGVAMQLSNIARDVGEDARAQRLYLPVQWLREAGIDPVAWLAAPVFDERLGTVIARLLDEAQAHYASSDAGIAALPWRCRPAMRIASALYAEIGREVARFGFDSVARRAVVPPARKLRLVASSTLRLRAPDSLSGFEPLEATRFLLLAVPPAELKVEPQTGWHWHRLDLQAERLIELFCALERRDLHARRAAAGRFNGISSLRVR